MLRKIIGGLLSFSNDTIYHVAAISSVMSYLMMGWDTPTSRGKRTCYYRNIFLKQLYGSNHSKCYEISRDLVGHFEWRHQINNLNIMTAEKTLKKTVPTDCLALSDTRTSRLTLISTWKSNHTHSQLWGEVTYLFLNGSRWSLGMNSYFILHSIRGVISYSCWDWNLSMLVKRGPCRRSEEHVHLRG